MQTCPPVLGVQDVVDKKTPISPITTTFLSKKSNWLEAWETSLFTSLGGQVENDQDRVSCYLMQESINTNRLKTGTHRNGI